MSTFIVHRTFTRTATRSLGINGTAIIEGGREGLRGGGTAIVDGTLSNAGTIMVDGGGPTDLHRHIPYGGVLSVTGVLANAGNIELLGGSPGIVGYQFGGSGGTLVNTGTITNSGLLQLDGGPGEQYGIGRPVAEAGGGYLSNQGTLLNSGTIAIAAGVLGGAPFLNGYTGVLATSGVLMNRGEILMQGGFGGVGGYYVGKAPGAFMNVTGVLTNSSVIQINGGVGGVDYGSYGGSGAYLLDSGQLFNSGTINIAGATGGTNHGAGGSGGRLEDQGTFDNSGMITLGYGTAGGTPTGTANLPTAGSGGRLQINGVAINSGSIALLDGAQPGDQAGQLLIDTAETFNNVGTIADAGVIDGSGTLINRGIINSGPNATITGQITAPTLVNDSAVQVASGGALLVDSNVIADAGASGVFDLAQNAMLTLGGMVAASQSVHFAGPATLLLGDAAGFAGILDGLGSSANIDFLGLDVISAHASPTDLVIGLQDGTNLDLSLGTALPAGTTLLLGSDGHGGTELHFGG